MTIKEPCCECQVFYVTEMKPLEDLSGGYLLRGTIRGKDRDQVIRAVLDGVDQMFGCVCGAADGGLPDAGW